MNISPYGGCDEEYAVPQITDKRFIYVSTFNNKTKVTMKKKKVKIKLPKDCIAKNVLANNDDNYIVVEYDIKKNHRKTKWRAEQ